MESLPVYHYDDAQNSASHAGNDEIVTSMTCAVCIVVRKTFVAFYG
jgi:hypothetical protein